MKIQSKLEKNLFKFIISLDDDMAKGLFIGASLFGGPDALKKAFKYTWEMKNKSKFDKQEKDIMEKFDHVNWKELSEAVNKYLL